MTSLRSVSLLLTATGCISTLLYAYMNSVSQAYGDATLNQAVVVYGGAALMCIVGASGLRSGRALLQDPKARRQVVLLVAGFGVLFRLLGLFTFPVLEDDFFRYLWDGWVFIDTGSPYGVAPASYFASDTLSERFEDILSGINYPEVATVYGPSLQLVFGLSYLIAPGQLWPLKCLLVCVDIAVVGLLLKLIQPARPQQLVCWMLYAWSPLLVKEFATTAHPDVLGALFVVVALLCFLRARHLFCGLLLALAVGVKPFALVAAPFVIGLRAAALVGFALGVILLTVPFLVLPASPSASLSSVGLFGTSVLAVWVPDGLRAMGEGWSFNALLNALATALYGLWPLVDAVLLVRVALAAFCVYWFLQLYRTLTSSPKSAAQLSQKFTVLFGLFLLVLPALNPWYLVWWLPFAVVSPYVTPWVASFALLISYASGINVATPDVNPYVDPYVDPYGLYSLPAWVLALEFVPIGIALLIDLYRARA